MVEVLVIGTEPPCPRCGLLTRKVHEIAAGDRAIRCSHIAYDTAEAEAFAESKGMRIGTAKQVAEAAGIRMDWRAVYAEIERARVEAGPGADPADTWTPYLDELLRPCEKAAEEVGFLMTPVLVVNGKVRHDGSVPLKEELLEFISC